MNTASLSSRRNPKEVMWSKLIILLNKKRIMVEMLASDRRQKAPIDESLS
jgi:hypothetical protein